MTSSQIVQQKFQAWALRRGITLQGSAGEHGAPNYVMGIAENVFGGCLLPEVEAAFRAGAGGELRRDIPSLWAIHSSAALAVNLFQYWVGRAEPGRPATLLAVPSRNITSYGFEDRFPVRDAAEEHGFDCPPHLDFAFRYEDGSRVGVECKLHEPYGRIGHAPLAPKYLELSGTWDDIPRWRSLAEELAGTPTRYHRLGASQLVKHVLGLKHGASSSRVRLVYLFYDAPGREAAEHRDELELLTQAVAGDPIRLQVLSVQEFIGRAVRSIHTEHLEYVDYLSERYL